MMRYEEEDAERILTSAIGAFKMILDARPLPSVTRREDSGIEVRETKFESQLPVVTPRPVPDQPTPTPTPPPPPTPPPTPMPTPKPPICPNTGSVTVVLSGITACSCAIVSGGPPAVSSYNISFSGLNGSFTLTHLSGSVFQTSSGSYTITGWSNNDCTGDQTTIASGSFVIGASCLNVSGEAQWSVGVQYDTPGAWPGATQVFVGDGGSGSPITNLVNCPSYMSFPALLGGGTATVS